MQSPAQLEQEGPLSSDDQLFLYETVSVLIVSSNLEPKVKAQLMKSLLAPIVGCFSVLISKYCEASDEKIKLIYAKGLNTAMSVASRVSKGFSLQVKLKDCDCVEIFLEILQIFMPVINITTHKNLIHSGFRQYLHRMFVCMDNEIIDYLPLTVENLLKLSNEPRDLYDLVPLLNQILNKFKQQSVVFLQATLMQFLNSVLNFVNSLPSEIASNLFKTQIVQPQNENNKPADSNLAAASIGVASQNQNNPPGFIDSQYIIDVQTLYKATLQYLLNIANNDLTEIIAGQAPADVYRVFLILLQGAQMGTPDITKICFQAIKKFLIVFGNSKFF